MDRWREKPEVKFRLKQYQLEWSQKQRRDTIMAYGGRCECCGETEYKFLTIDHIEGNGNRERKALGGSQNFWTFLRVAGYPPGYRVLCYNCNCGRQRNGGVCPHTGQRMTVTECDVPELVLPDDPNRPAGVHVSGILTDILQRMEPARYNKRGRNGHPASMHIPKISAGRIYEQRLEKLLVEAEVVPGLFRPEPIQKDGIWGSPDGIDPDLWAPVEYKLTWYSGKKVFPDDKVYWPYLVQVKAYDYLLDSLRAVIWIQYINGDYAPPKPWAPKKYLLEFTPTEIAENWAMLVNHAKSLGWL